MADLLRLALRRNPKRAQLLVSTVLGKHLPADPRVIAGIGRLLGALVARELAGERRPVPAQWVGRGRQHGLGRRPGGCWPALPDTVPHRPSPAC